MEYTIVLRLDLVKIFNNYLIGCIVAFICWLTIKIIHYFYLKKEYNENNIKQIYKRLTIRDVFWILLSWYVPIMILIEIVEETLKKLNKKYYKSYKYRRFKDVLLFRKKETTINNYFERVLKKDIKKVSTRRLIYRIKNGDIIIDYYSDSNWKDIKNEITIDDFEYFFGSDDVQYLQALYKDLVKKRFMSRYE